MDRCSLCPRINNYVPASIPKCNHYTSGTDSKRVMFIGEAPGKDEDRQKRVFVGKTGQELEQHYLPLAGLRRENVTITNAISCLPVGYAGKLDMGRTKDIDLLQCCANHHLYGEIQEMRPSILVPMGAFACYAIDPDIQLDLQHGIPLETSWGTVLPMYHPAGGIHEPKKMLLIRNDWIRLGKYLKGKLRQPKDEYPNPDYQEQSDANLPDSKTITCSLDRPMACDTEVTRHREPFCLTYSLKPGTGRLIRADQPKTLKYFQLALDRWRGPILWHNWLFDQRVVSDMGLRFPKHLIVDTMALSFHLGNLPQGLKALAYRELGMVMEDFDDLVTPYSTPLCLEYLRKAYGEEWPKPEPSLIRDADGLWKLYQPQSFSTKLKRFLSGYNGDAESIYKAWDNWEADHDLIQSVMGPWPGKDIRYVPFEKALYYSCRDADALLRLWPVLQRMRRRVRRTLQENWGDT